MPVTRVSLYPELEAGESMVQQEQWEIWRNDGVWFDPNIEPGMALVISGI